jgi:hypothetical protein
MEARSILTIGLNASCEYDSRTVREIIIRLPQLCQLGYLNILARGTTGFAHIDLCETETNLSKRSVLPFLATLALFNHIVPGDDPYGSALFDNQPAPRFSVTEKGKKYARPGKMELGMDATVRIPLFLFLA